MKWLLLLSLLLFSSVSLAKEVPKPSPFDSRIQTVDYQKSEVVVVSVHAASAVRIVFSKEEEIVDVASGFTEGWELLARGHILYLKARSLPGEGDTSLTPSPQKWNTNLMVTTSMRLYDFELSLVPSAKRAAFRVEFRYPAYELAQLAKQDKQAKEKKKLSQSYAPKNWDYAMKVRRKSQSIAPKVVYDDGNFTYLQFPNNRNFPAAFLVDGRKNERLVNSHVEGDRLILHRVAKHIRLRFGKQIVEIYNQSFDPDGAPPKEGTTAPNTKRTLKGGQ